MENIIPNSSDVILIEQLRNIYSSSCYNELLALSQKSSLLTRLEKEDSETILSKLIKNVLCDVSINNSLPVAPMGFLLRFVVSKLMEEGEVSALYTHLLANPRLDVETSYINTEESIDYGTKFKKKGRIDIFAKGKIKYPHDDKEEEFCLVIENKIKTKQHDSQCQNYYEYIEKKYIHIPYKFYILLDPKGGKAECKSYINMTYNEFMCHVLDPLLSEIKHLGDRIPKDYQRDLVELIDTLQHPAEFMSDQPIALSKEYRNLLSQFYKENRELILLAAKECANDEDFRTIEKGFEQRRSSVNYSISHPNIPENVHTNEKSFLETLFKQYIKLNKDFEWIKTRFKKIGKLYVEPCDSTTGYGDIITLSGIECKISTQLGRKNRKFNEIVKIAKEDGFIISE